MQHSRVCLILLSILSAPILAGEAAVSDKSGAEGAGKSSVVQIDISALLNARPVSTLTAGKLVTWNTFVDGYGKGSAYLTMAAALAVGDKNPKALPDNPLIPANGKRPEILLHYSNEDAEKSQARKVVNDEPLIIPVPKRKYRQMFLAWTSGDGGSEVRIDLVYSDGAGDTRTVRVTDYYNEVASNNPTWTYVVRDLNKWGPSNKLTEGDGGHHSIHAVDIAPDHKRELEGIKAVKSPGKSQLLFWAATGISDAEQAP